MLLGILVLSPSMSCLHHDRSSVKSSKAAAGSSGARLDHKDILSRGRHNDVSCPLSHELIGSSILFTYDQEAAPGSAEAGVWMIDFAHTRKATGGALSHKKPWNGSSQDREDGYLVGLDKLIEIFSRVIQ